MQCAHATSWDSAYVMPQCLLGNVVQIARKAKHSYVKTPEAELISQQAVLLAYVEHGNQSPGRSLS